MNQATDLPRSTLGRKILMAVTGIALMGFVLGHMLGNLKIFQGAEKLDAYAHWLRDFGYPALSHGQFLWIARLALLGAVGTHMWAAVSLARQNKTARPVGYRLKRNEASSYASRTMTWGGIIIVLFVIYHIMHFTTGDAHHNFTSSPYANVVAGFQIWWVAGIYIVAQAALAMHLYHGFWSLFRTLGARGSWDSLLRSFAAAFAVIVAGGNILIPVAVLTGLVK